MMEFGKRLRDGTRRDSGYSLKEDSESESASPDKDSDIVTRNSCDSGLGCGSPVTGLAQQRRRRWGRRYTRRSELRTLRHIRRSLQELASSFGGEVAFTYTPRHHPNLPDLPGSQTKLLIPMKELRVPAPHAAFSTQPGQFMARAGLTPEDVRDNRFPDIPFGGLAVLSNGLALDLLRLAEESPEIRPSITQFIFRFLEIKFPSELEARASDSLLSYLSENKDYVEDCKDEGEADSFLVKPFIIPDEISVMASILEDTEDELDESDNEISSPYSEFNLATSDMNQTVVSTDSLLIDNNMCIRFVDEESGYELSSVADVFSDNVAPSHGGDGSDALTDNEAWTAYEGDIIHAEDENFSVTATVVSVDSQLGKLMAASVAHPAAHRADLTECHEETDFTLESLDTSKDLVNEEKEAQTHQSETKKRSRTREVQVPSRYKDFDTVSPYKRSRKT